ncbi:hypothetical protein [Mycetohabitans rhizoxinica]|uniref:hypothetical protein n=1 Tax=Mycetohabitans rhizoxinica TaxID=412963 RepID=UPI0030D3F432
MELPIVGKANPPIIMAHLPTPLVTRSVGKYAGSSKLISMLTMNNELIQPSEVAMSRIISVILMLWFSLVSVPAWSDIGQYTTATPAPQEGTMRVQDIQITNVVAEDTACPENGRIARDANGTPLFCQSGRWSYATASGGRYVCAGLEECGFSTTWKKYENLNWLFLTKRNESKKTQWFMIDSPPQKHDHEVCRVGGFVKKRNLVQLLGEDIKLRVPKEENEAAFLKGCSVTIPVPPGSFGTLWIRNFSSEKDGPESNYWAYHVSIYE